MRSFERAAPVGNRFLTPGVIVLLSLMCIGFMFGAARFLFGLGVVTNLNNQFPWGLWIGIDVVTGVALAAGGFTTSALAYVFNRDQFHAVVRPALLTAMLGYTFVTLGLVVDVGRYWNIWRPIISWNPQSVLFEVAMCVAAYSTVLYIEFIPIVAERFKGRIKLPGRLRILDRSLEWLMGFADRILGRVMFLFVIAGIVLSFLHQSGLGSLMLIAPYKVHPLWYTPILPLLFLLSAIGVGYPMVVFESLIVSKSLKREPEMTVLTPLAKFMPVLIGLYFAVKLGDMIVRGTYIYLLDGTLQSNAFIVEVLFGLILPFLLLCFKRVRESAGWLFFAATLYILGVVLNRVNVFVVSFTPPYMMERYFPAVGEFAVTIGFIATLIFLYRIFITLFPVLRTGPQRRASTLVLLTAFSLIFWMQSSADGAEAITSFY
jgi:Ni/Fe-hydrogenase subunit HybB-like protein